MICIVASETEDFKKLLDKVEIIDNDQFGVSTITEAVFKGKKLLFLATGYNKINLGLAMGYIIEKYEIDGIIGLGNCGYIEDNGLRIEDIAIAKNSVQYSVNSTAIGYPDTVIPGIGLGVFNCSPYYIKIAEKACENLKYKYFTGKFATGEKFIADSCERKYISEKYLSQFIDMECGGLGQTAYLFNIPSVFIKGISNYANDCAENDYERYADCAIQKSNEVVYEMLKILYGGSNMSCCVNLSDYKILTMWEIEKVIQNCEFVNLGVSENNQPYIVPMCFKICEYNNDTITLYSIDKGRKMTCIHNNDKVVLEFNFYQGKSFKSVIAFGIATISNTSDEKICDDDLVKIQVKIDEITGREYFNCNK